MAQGRCWCPDWPLTECHWCFLSRILAHFCLDVWIQLLHGAWPLHKATLSHLMRWFDRCRQFVLLNPVQDTLFDLAVIDEVFVVVGTPPTEPVDHRLSVKLRSEMLPETLLKLFNLQKAILIIINVFDWAPNFGCSIAILSHNRSQIILINLF